MNNFTRHIDGTPGITLEGKKGETGKRGCMTFLGTPSMNTHENFGNLFDIWDIENETSVPWYSDAHNIYENTQPEQDDFAICHRASHVESYYIKYVIPSIVLVDEERFYKEYSDTGILSRSYVKKIFNYYSSAEYNGTLKQCCLVNIVSSTFIDVDPYNNTYDLEIGATEVSYDYKKRTGEIDANNKLEIETSNTFFTKFYVQAQDICNFTNVRIEIEFSKSYISAKNPLSSVVTHLWDNPLDLNDSTYYPEGRLENYMYNLNFDAQDLKSFNVVIMDFDAEPNSTTLKYDSPVQLYSNMLQGYTGKIFVYHKTADIITKTYIGDYIPG